MNFKIICFLKVYYLPLQHYIISITIKVISFTTIELHKYTRFGSGQSYLSYLFQLPEYCAFSHWNNLV